MLKAIAAVTRDGGLGRNGALLVQIPADLHRFKTLTLGDTLVMGRETLDSLPGGRPLPGRRNLVLSRDKGFRREGAEVFHSTDELLRTIPEEETVWVIGGASVYQQLLPLCAELYLTKVDAIVPADRFFPALGEEWRLAEASDWQEENGVRYRFERYAQKR
jgi:dihydrofolate reductase